jgi:hypothetical protein
VSTTTMTPAPKATRGAPAEPGRRTAEGRTFLDYIRAGNGPPRRMTPRVEAALRAGRG